MRSIQHALPASPVTVAAGSLLAAPDEARQPLSLPQSAFLAQAMGALFNGGLYLFGGAPASGKSLLSMQIGLDLAEQGYRSLYILTEQTPAAMKVQASRSVRREQKKRRDGPAEIRTQDLRHVKATS